MSSSPLRILACVALPADTAADLAGSAFGPFALESCADGAELSERLQNCAGDSLLLLLAAEAGDAVREIVEHMAADVATVIVSADAGAAAMLDWLLRGAQDVLGPEDLTPRSLAPRLRAAFERKRLEREARKAYATDLETGLPHQQQFIEHMSHLLALREREPAPMAVLVLRIEGLATTEAQFGREASHVLRRKLAVRLRADVRTSDIVASIGDDSFAVLLGSILTPADAPRVGTKLLAALHRPFKVSGNDVPVAAALGIAQYPDDGDQPDALLRRAVGIAAAAPAQGRAGFANFKEAGGRAPSAANDE